MRCNVSSWYVEPAQRGHAAILASMASKLKHVTYINTSAATHNWPILKALGYQLYSQGAVRRRAGADARREGARQALRPWLPRQQHTCRIRVAAPQHADAGCDALVFEADDRLVPFVFMRRHIAGLPFAAMQLIYARDTADFAACAGPLGRFFLAHGAPVVICDAPGPVRGLPGIWFRRRGARYYKGPEPRG